MKYLGIIFTIVLAQPLFAAEKLIYTGEIFDKSGKTKVFTYERYQDVQGDKVLDRAVYKNMDGEVQTEEKMESVKGELVRYDMDQKQLKQKAWIEVDDKNITFNLKKWRKRNYPISTKRKSNFIMGLQIVDFVVKHWDEFKKGKEQEISLGVWHRQEAIRFDLSNDKMENGKMVIKMNPSSMFIRAVVDPIYFTFDTKTKELVEYSGRVVPKEKRNKGYYDYDGLVRYKKVMSK